MDIYDFLYNAMITDITYIRGYGIIPSTICIYILKNSKEYRLQTEINFRIIYKNKCILCFDDVFLDKSQIEMSVKKFRSQKDIEKSLLYENLMYVSKIVINKKIKNVKIYDYGDIILKINNNCKLQIINDTHLINSSILRISTKNTEDKIITENGNEFFVEHNLFEMVNGKNNEIVFLND